MLEASEISVLAQQNLRVITSDRTWETEGSRGSSAAEELPVRVEAAMRFCQLEMILALANSCLGLAEEGEGEQEFQRRTEQQ